MKKNVLLAILLVISYSGVSQDKITVEIAGITINALNINSDDNEIMPYEMWVVSLEGIYTMFFKETAVGYKHSLDRVKSILEKNNLSFDNDRVNESILIPDHCDSIFDYHCLPHEFYMGNAEVDIWWITKDGDGINLKCHDEAFYIALARRLN